METNRREATTFKGKMRRVFGAESANIEKIIEKSTIKDAQKKLEQDNAKKDKICATLEEIKRAVKDLRLQHCPDINTTQFDAVLGFILTLVNLPEIKLHGVATTKAAVHGGGVDIATNVALGLTLGVPVIGLIGIVSEALSPDADTLSSIIKQLTDVVKQLEGQKRAIKKFARI